MLILSALSIYCMNPQSMLWFIIELTITICVYGSRLANFPVTYSADGNYVTYVHGR